LLARRRLTLQELLCIPEVIDAKMRVEEAIAAYQYTGPLFQVDSKFFNLACNIDVPLTVVPQQWNGVLRSASEKSSDRRFTTSIHVLVSAVLKLARASRVPPGRVVWRGLGGLVLDHHWFQCDGRGVRGGAELGFLSATSRRSVALEYSGVKQKRGVLLELEVGAVDNGARLDMLSQYPGMQVFDSPRFFSI
jgi:hypothetical protein